MASHDHTENSGPSPAAARGALGWPLRRVVAVNVVLLAILVSMSLGPGAGAQPGAPAGPARARGDYTMLSGKTNTGNTSAVYVLDGANQELIALRWDNSRQRLISVGYRNLDADAKAPPTR